MTARHQAAWSELYSRLPAEFVPYQLELAWDISRLWSLDLPVEHMPVGELAWQLTLPWWRDGDRYFAVSPLQVARDPDKHADRIERVLAADLTRAISIMRRNERWFILDGVHRLLKAVLTDLGSIRYERCRPRRCL